MTELTGHGISKKIDAYGEGVFEIEDSSINVIISFNREILENHSTLNGSVDEDLLLAETE